jgi:hypothetical protein
MHVPKSPPPPPPKKQSLHAQNSPAPAARSLSPYLQLSPSVRQALAAAQPVVALESTIITHGMPYPENLKTAREVEAVVRAHGACLCDKVESNRIESNRETRGRVPPSPSPASTQ